MSARDVFETVVFNTVLRPRGRHGWEPYYDALFLRPMRDEWFTDSRLAEEASRLTKTQASRPRITQWRESARVRMLVKKNPDEDGEWGITDEGRARLRRVRFAALLPFIGLLLAIAGFAAGPMGADPLIVGAALFLAVAFVLNVFQYSRLWERFGRWRAMYAWKLEQKGRVPPAMQAAPADEAGTR